MVKYSFSSRFQALCSTAFTVLLFTTLSTLMIAQTPVWTPPCTGGAQQRWLKDWNPKYAPDGRQNIIHSIVETNFRAGYLSGGMTDQFGNQTPSNLSSDFHWILGNLDGTMFEDAAIGGSEDEICYDAVETGTYINQSLTTNTVGIIGAGVTTSFRQPVSGGPVNNMLITRTVVLGGNNFSHSWSRVIGTENSEEEGRAVREVFAGGYIAVGSSTDADGIHGCQPSVFNPDILVVRLDDSGNPLVSSRLIGGCGTDEAFDVEEFFLPGHPDFEGGGGFIVTGRSGSINQPGGVFDSRFDLCAVWLNYNLDIIHTRTFNYSGRDSEGWSGKPVYDAGGALEGFVFAGNVRTANGDRDALVLKTNINGNINWTARYGGTELDQAFDIRPVLDVNGDYTRQLVFTGRTHSYSAGGTDAQVYLVAVADPAGSGLPQSGFPVASTTYGNSDLSQPQEWANSLYQAGDLGFVMAGPSNGLGNRTWDGIVVKADCALGVAPQGSTVCLEEPIATDYVKLDNDIQNNQDFSWSFYHNDRLTPAEPDIDVKTHAASNCDYHVEFGPPCCAEFKQTFHTYYQLGDQYYGEARDVEKRSNDYAVFGGLGIPTGPCTGGMPRNRDATISLYDGAGNLTQSIAYGGEETDQFNGGIQSDQNIPGGFTACGFNGSPPSLGTGAIGNEDAYFVQLDPNGLWSNSMKYGGAQPDRLTDIVELSDGGYIMTGFTESYGAGKRDVYVIKTDVIGTVTWAYAYGGSEDDAGWSIAEVKNDPAGRAGYVVVGETQSFSSPDHGLRDIYILRLDQSGMIDWAYIYGGTNHEIGYSIREVEDPNGKGLIVGAETVSYSNVDNDAFIFRLNYDGDYVEKGSGVSIRNVYGRLSQLSYEGCRSIVYSGCNDPNSFDTYTFGGYLGDQQLTGWDAYGVRIDYQGGIVWDMTYGSGPGTDFAWDVQYNLADGSSSFAGMAEPTPGDFDQYFLNAACNGSTDNPATQMPCGYAQANSSTAVWLDKRFAVKNVTSQSGNLNTPGTHFMPYNEDYIDLVNTCLYTGYRTCYDAANSNKQSLAPDANPAEEGRTGMIELHADQVSLYPNPVNPGSDITVRFEAEAEASYLLTLADIVGREVYRARVQASSGSNTVAVPTGSFRAGTYTVRIDDGKHTVKRAIVVVQ